MADPARRYWPKLLLLISMVLSNCGAGKSVAPGDIASADNSGVLDLHRGDSLAEVKVPGDIPPPVPDKPADVAALVEPHRIWSDLVLLSKPRPPGSEQWQLAQDLCADRFAALGYEVSIEPFDMESHSGVNVLGTLPGSGLPDEMVYISAHYDHIADCDGADDNASGIAGVLESARVLAAASYRRTLVVACWDLEELGLKGSRAHTARLKEGSQEVVVSFVYEMIGYRSMEPGSQEIPPGLDLLFPEEAALLAANDYKGNSLVVVADSFAHLPAKNLAFFAEQLTATPVVLLELDQAQKNSPIFFTLQRSDHGAFWLEDYPAMMLTDTAEYRNKNYHCTAGPDSVDRLDRDYAADIVRATTAAAAMTLEFSAEE